jgi:hypothetical protein
MTTLGEYDIRNINQVLTDVVFMHSSLFKTLSVTRAMKNGERIQMKAVGCVQQEDFVSADYCFLWHMDTTMRFQWDFSSTENFKKYCLQIENGNFDQSVELAKVRNIFGTIIKNEGITAIGLFYCGNGTPCNPSS